MGVSSHPGPADSVAVTGVGVVSPIGSDWRSFRESLWAPRPGIREMDILRASNTPTDAAGQVHGFRLTDFASRSLSHQVRRLGDRRAELGCAALSAAFDDAKLLAAYRSERIGVVVGTGSISYTQRELNSILSRYGRKPNRSHYLSRACTEPASPLPQRHFVDHVVHRTADALGAGGPRFVHISTCAASAVAVGHGLRLLRAGSIDACLVGGFDSLLTPTGLATFSLLGALSTSTRPASERLRPFERNRDGMLIGEGATILALERTREARERGAFIYGEIAGFGSSMDAFSVLAPRSDGEGAASAMRRALEDACAEASQVDYVNAHGTATVLNDPSETRAIRLALGSHADSTPVSSSKPYFGHLIGASGAIETLVALAAIYDQKLPPTLNLEEPDPECDLDYVPLTPRSARIQLAASNSFGFGGYNACVVVREAPR